jgi:hypothetical protein
VPDTIKPPLPGREATNDGADLVDTHPRSLIRELNRIGADVLYWGNRRYNKISDRERAIRSRIRRRNPPRRSRLHSKNQESATT